MTASGFLRGPRGVESEPPVVLDDAQQAVLGLADDASAAVLGAPGTGKTTTLVELVADRVHRARLVAPDEVLVLTSSRGTATRLRDRLALRLGVPTNGPLARTVNSLAFEIVGARRAGRRRRPPAAGHRRRTGRRHRRSCSQGHVEDGTGPAWPEHARRRRCGGCADSAPSCAS